MTVTILRAAVPLKERLRRRVEFAGGAPIVLPDGRPWRFYEPTPVVREGNGGDDHSGLMIVWDFGAELDAETNESLGYGFHRLLTKVHRATNDRDRACGVIEAAWFLLARNYVISQEEFEDLLLRGNRALKRPVRLLRDHVLRVAQRVDDLLRTQRESV